jgi:hypothetical protein
MWRTCWVTGVIPAIGPSTSTTGTVAMPSGLARSRECAAERQRRHRELERNGLIVLPVVVDEAAMSVAMVDAGLISINDQDDRQKLAAALSRVVAVLIAEMPLAVSRVTVGDHNKW